MSATVTELDFVRSVLSVADQPPGSSRRDGRDAAGQPKTTTAPARPPEIEKLAAKALEQARRGAVGAHKHQGNKVATGGGGGTTTSTTSTTTMQLPGAGTPPPRPQPQPETAAVTAATTVTVAQAADDRPPSTTRLPVLTRLPISFSSAMNTDNNTLLQLDQAQSNSAMYVAIAKQRAAIGQLVLHHAGYSDRDYDIAVGSKDGAPLPSTTGRRRVVVAHARLWIRGTFNVCVPVEVHEPFGGPVARFIFRCVMPFKLAEAHYPGAVDEKVACEVGAYAWMQAHCPDIRIPHLYGFSFADGTKFTHVAHRRWPVRAWFAIRRWFHHRSLGLARWLQAGLTTTPPDAVASPLLLSQYTRHPGARLRLQDRDGTPIPTSYMLLEDVRSDACGMLSLTWHQHCGDPVRRATLFRGMAHVMLALARVPLPRIGSLRFDRASATVAVANRPLDCTTALLESEGTPRAAAPDTTYATVDPYVADLFALHDARLATYRNVIMGDRNCRQLMAARVLMRALAHRYAAPPERRAGPFFLQLTDLHASNIFVHHADWRLHCLIDLEWICAQPADMLSVPYWLTGQDIGGLVDEPLDAYNRVRDEFVRAFEIEEQIEIQGRRNSSRSSSSKRSSSSSSNSSKRRPPRQHALALTPILRDTWTSGAYWFWHGLSSINAMHLLFEQHLCAQYSPELTAEDESLLARFWTPDADRFVEKKVADYHAYEADLKAIFNNPPAATTKVLKK